MTKINPYDTAAALPSFYHADIMVEIDEQKELTDFEINYFEQSVLSKVFNGELTIDSIIYFTIQASGNIEKARAYIYYTANKLAYMAMNNALEMLVVKAEQSHIIREFDDVKLMLNITLGYYERGFEYDEKQETDQIPAKARESFINFFNHCYAYQKDIIQLASTLLDDLNFISTLKDYLHSLHKEFLTPAN